MPVDNIELCLLGFPASLRACLVPMLPVLYKHFPLGDQHVAFLQAGELCLFGLLTSLRGATPRLVSILPVLYEQMLMFSTMAILLET